MCNRCRFGGSIRPRASPASSPPSPPTGSPVQAAGPSVCVGAMRAVHLACVDAQNRGDRHEELRKLKELQTFLVGARTAPLLRQQVLALERSCCCCMAQEGGASLMGTRGKMTTGTRVGRAHGRGSNHTRHLTHRQSFLQQIRTGSSCRRHRLYLPPDGGPHQIFQQPMRRLQLLRWLQQLLALLLMPAAAAAAPSTPHIVDNDTSDADDGPCSPTGRFPTRSHLATAMATRSVGEELDAQKQAAEDDDEAGMPACSQFSQASQGASGYDDEHKCAVCHDLLYEPVCGPCRHHLCRACFYPAVKVAMCCPLCRAPISLAQGDPPVDRELWEALQQSYPDVVARRRKRMGGQGVGASSAEGTGVPAAAGVAQHEPPAELVRDRIRAQMGTHRRLLTSALPEYCTLLEYELARPIHEIARCKCPERFVMVRRQVRREGGNRGREYQSCPLSRPTSQQRGTGQESRFGCGAFQWVV